MAGLGTFGSPEELWADWALGQWALWVEWKIRNLTQPGSPEFQWVMARSLDWFRTAFALDIWRNFTQSRSPAGRKWAKLKYRSGKPLILTGAMFASAVESARNRTRSYGSMILMEMARTPFYWIFHEYGTKNIPARPFFGPRPATVVALAGQVAYNCMRVITGR